jgi:NADH:ubiquinone oxidoreductase subunit C
MVESLLHAMRKMNSFLSGLSLVGSDYLKLNKATWKDHFPLPFIDEMLERLANHTFFYYLDGYSGYHRIPIHLDIQNKTTFTCPYDTFAYR